MKFLILFALCALLNAQSFNSRSHSFEKPHVKDFQNIQEIISTLDGIREKSIARETNLDAELNAFNDYVDAKSGSFEENYFESVSSKVAIQTVSMLFAGLIVLTLMTLARFLKFRLSKRKDFDVEFSKERLFVSKVGNEKPIPFYTQI